MEDITPSLLKEIRTAFYKEYGANKKIKQIDKAIKDGTASYNEAYAYANEVGNIRAKVLKNKISSAKLPDGKMYFNIADRVVRDSLETDYKNISSICEQVQFATNIKHKISLKVQVPELDEDRVMGFINRISSENFYDDIAWILEEPVKTFDRKVVDDSVKKNASFQHRAGIRATVIRIADSKCCTWCSDLAGEYTYPNVDSEVFMRHDNCKCSLQYEGRKMTAYSRNFME